MDEAVIEEATVAVSAIVQILTVGDRVLRAHHITDIHHSKVRRRHEMTVEMIDGRTTLNGVLITLTDVLITLIDDRITLIDGRIAGLILKINLTGRASVRVVLIIDFSIHRLMNIRNYYMNYRLF